MSHYTDSLHDAFPGRDVTEADGLVTVHHELSRRDAILAVARELAATPMVPMQAAADRLIPLGVDTAPDSEDFRAFAVLVTCALHRIAPSEKALAWLLREVAAA